MKDTKDDYGSPEVSRYLQELSERVRALRARRGMTRKDLAQHSGISERYLAQLENGAANPSIELLWRIVHAMDIRFQELVADQSVPQIAHPPLLALLQGLSPDEQAAAYSLLVNRYTERRENFHGVALIGLRGAGKTTLGHRLSERFGVPFVRLGDLIENLGGMNLAEVFSLGGQKTYRRLERQAVEHVIEHYRGAVVETGGSLVSEADTFSLLRSHLYSVWLRADPEDHMSRVTQQGDLRPMQSSEEAMADLRRILVEREPYYGAAEYSMSTSGRTIEDCLDELERVCRPYLGGGDRTADGED